MKPSTRKALLSTAILTAGFSLMVIAGPAIAQGDSIKLGMVGTVVMSMAVFASALVWARGPDD